MDFFEFGSNEVTKTKRILVYPNITYSKDLEQDSYVQVMKKLIFELSKIRDDLYWYIISPEKIKGLQFDNVYQFITPFPTYPPTMRCHFDTFSIKEHLLKNIVKLLEELRVLCPSLHHQEMDWLYQQI